MTSRTAASRSATPSSLAASGPTEMLPQGVSYRVGRVLAVPVLSVIVCAGCVGSGAGEMFSAEATAACLQRAGVVIDKGPASIAGTPSSSEGLRALLGGREVVVVFHHDVADAKQTERLFEMLDKAVERNPELMSRTRNAVMFWKKTPPTEGERATLLGCLRTG